MKQNSIDDNEMEFSNNNTQIPDYLANQGYFETDNRDNQPRLSLSPIERFQLWVTSIFEFLRIDTLFDINIEPHDNLTTSQKMMRQID